METLTAWRDEAYTNLELVDSGSAYQSLQDAAATAAGYLVEISFTLVPERFLVLESPRSIVDVCAQCYGAVDEKLDFFIATNKLSGSKILELPAGQMIRFYA
jgi:hypothetical protein